MPDCKHMNFNASVTVNRLEDTGKFMAGITIECRDCKTPFGFKGLKAGLDLGGAAVCPTGREARLAIEPLQIGKYGNSQ